MQRIGPALHRELARFVHKGHCYWLVAAAEGRPGDRDWSDRVGPKDLPSGMIRCSAGRRVEAQSGAERSLALLGAGEVGRLDQSARKASLSRSGRAQALTLRFAGTFGGRDHFRRRGLHQPIKQPRGFWLQTAAGLLPVGQSPVAVGITASSAECGTQQAGA